MLVGMFGLGILEQLAEGRAQHPGDALGQIQLHPRVIVGEDLGDGAGADTELARECHATEAQHFQLRAQFGSVQHGNGISWVLGYFGC